MGYKHKSLKKTKIPLLDLHGMTTEEAYDAIEKFIYKHKQANTKQVKVMPGKGTGALHAEATKYLKQAGYSWHYEPTTTGQNKGVIIVPMD